MDSNPLFNKRYNNVNNRMEDNRMARFLKHLLGAGIGCIIALLIVKGLTAWMGWN